MRMGFSMGALEIILGSILLVFALGLSAIVLLQEGHQKNMGAITGGAETFLSKNKARSLEAKLERVTKFVAIGFFLVVIIINIIMYFFVK